MFKYVNISLYALQLQQLPFPFLTSNQYIESDNNFPFLNNTQTLTISTKFVTTLTTKIQNTSLNFDLVCFSEDTSDMILRFCLVINNSLSSISDSSHQMKNPQPWSCIFWRNVNPKIGYTWVCSKYQLTLNTEGDFKVTTYIVVSTPIELLPCMLLCGNA